MIQKNDYAGQFEYVVENVGDKKPKLLLHVCCAPCTTYCLTKILPHFDVTLYYCNDNITDENEWQKRLGEVQKLVEIVNGGQFEVSSPVAVKLVVKPHEPMQFLQWAKDYPQRYEGGERCTLCYKMRLTYAQNYANEHGYDYFGTTLTVSPYKPAQVINPIGFALESDGGAKWLPTNFKKHGGYDESIRLANKYGLYRQEYCGCPYTKEF